MCRPTLSTRKESLVAPLVLVAFSRQCLFWLMLAAEQQNIVFRLTILRLSDMVGTVYPQ